MIERNTIYNCDCFELFKQMPNNFVDVTFTSPPYNSQRHKKYNGFEYEYDSYYEFLCKLSTECLRVTKKYVILNVQANYYNRPDVYKFIGEFSKKIQRTVIWNKTNPTPSSMRCRLTNSYEFFFILSKGEPVKCNSFFLKDVITFPINSNKINGHSAVMNKDVCTLFIKEFTKSGDLVFDPFMGMGTTALSCAENERDYIGTEIVKEYCDSAIERVRNESNIQTSMDGLLETC